MYDNYSYLIHSAKGSTWSKKDHKYYKKVKSAKTGHWIYYYKINGKDIGLVDESHGYWGYGDPSDEFRVNNLTEEDEKFLDQYAARLKTLDILNDGKYLKNDEKRYIDTKPGYSLPRQVSLNSTYDKTTRTQEQNKEARQKVAKEILSAGTTRDHVLDFSGNGRSKVTKPKASTIKETKIAKNSPFVNKVTTNDYYRDMYYKDNQKALAKGIKKLKNKK